MCKKGYTGAVCIVERGTHVLYACVEKGTHVLYACLERGQTVSAEESVFFCEFWKPNPGCQV